MINTQRTNWSLMLIPLSLTMISAAAIFLSYSSFLSRFNLFNFADYVPLVTIFSFISLFYYRNPEKGIKAYFIGGIVFFGVRLLPAIAYGPIVILLSWHALILYALFAFTHYFLHILILKLVGKNQTSVLNFLLAISLAGAMLVSYINIHDLLAQFRVIPAVTSSGDLKDCDGYIMDSYRKSCEKYIIHLKEIYPWQYPDSR